MSITTQGAPTAGAAISSAVRVRLGNAAVLLALLLTALAFARWQGGPWWIAMPPGERWWLAGATVLAYFGLCTVPLLRTRKRPAALDADEGESAVLLAWASQTGFAEQLAEHSASALRGVGIAARVHPLHEVDIEMLKRHRRALFIASTTGEGDPPDHALGFTRDVLGQAAALPGLQYAVLALGDRSYANFCAFGLQLDRWLQHSGARPLFDRVDVDAGDTGALRHWQYGLGQLAGRADLPDWCPPAYRPWRLHARRLLNAGSEGGPVYEIALVPEQAGELDWQAGDIAEIGPRHPAHEVTAWLHATGLDGDSEVHTDGAPTTLSALLSRARLPDPANVHDQNAQALAESLQPMPHREYSIASTAGEGRLHLLVRQVRHPDGRLGSGSGWLTAHAAGGDRIDLRIRRNPGFHLPADDRPLILVGNGTGLAGLRALVMARIERGHARNWLLFGERRAAFDFHHRDEIETWLHQGWLQRLDLAFSRDGGMLAADSGQALQAHPFERPYVQDLLRRQAGRLREWLDAGAAVYVCGSLQGMAPGVDAMLREQIGTETLEKMAADGRYRRDVY
ncbi:flavodoxin domain-containing protein [Marilutibacter alkalisoli]|uniref:NADPH--hemoprotein reductase n=1 Tax=Marilutibacter alkalisoli TaxID=2591633 RepID=A0A514BPQ9_9GAMM|nr:sulfite reductase flavoprotein subunit alpha [Lysobacter alkalisoli]QDH69366.1 sulfite reductase flavoprotein subunit alpha [Lysobacter alkalisoli]